MNHVPPKPGDTVVLNTYGLETIYGSDTGLQHMKTLKMKVRSVGKKSLTAPEKTFDIKVDNKDIDQFLINSRCFDVVNP